MRALVGGGVIGTVLGGIAFGLMLVRRRGASGRVPSQIVPPTPCHEDLEDLRKEQLYERARTANITGRSKMSKHGLIMALRES